ncbi:MAG: YkgJ family cysteine cluster protein [Desulfobacter sp.]|nr:MAG: YkgJ family cysteine cluster protein [Desulfobacter sp.]
MKEDMIPVALGDPMGFNCSSENSCFNECCRDLNQALSPYDILRMKNALGMSSQAFLRNYTTRHNGPGTGLPVVGFKPNPATGHTCPFVSESGCTVYEDRPGSCRLYPLARAISRDRNTGVIHEYYALIEEDHCKGEVEPEAGPSVGQWLEGQKVAEHNRENDKLIELISLKNQIIPGELEGAESDIVYMALYDLDEFREAIFNRDLLKDISIDPGLMEKIKIDDLSLLDFGMAWVKYQLFGRDLDI